MLSPQPRIPAAASSDTMGSWNYKVFSESTPTQYGLSDSLLQKESESSSEVVVPILREDSIEKHATDQQIINEVMEAVHKYERELRNKQQVKKPSEAPAAREKKQERENQPSTKKPEKVKEKALKRKAPVDRAGKKKTVKKERDVFSLMSDEGEDKAKRKPLKQRNHNEANIITRKPSKLQVVGGRRDKTTATRSCKPPVIHPFFDLKETTLTNESLALLTSSLNTRCSRYWDKNHIKEWSLKMIA
eukprot:TRINITY_DN4977_c0_g6_i1.p1 TRINITY_DN4977_c0_g6~~TRINITY_DN4977_c0_g6_i1.p1  ORF type:complete len:246 (+),score=55.49 TRINITY_DN4977_c0_g6_i1:49-786(+)